jgi:hypothetical protein
MGFAIDTLQYAKKLRAVGFSEAQAEAQVEILAEAVRDSLVTKADLNEGLDKLRADLRVEFRDFHSSLIRWLIPLLIGQVAVFTALNKLL